MADPNVTTAPIPDAPLSPLMQWLVPLAGAAMTAYSPGHLGQGVGAFNQLFGSINALRTQQKAQQALAGLSAQDTPDTTTTTPGSTTMQPDAAGAFQGLSAVQPTQTELNQTPPTQTFSLTGNKNVASGVGLGLQNPTPAQNLNQSGDTGTSGKQPSLTDASLSNLTPAAAAAAKAAAITTPATTTTTPGHHTSMLDFVKALAPYYPEQAAQMGTNALTQQTIWGNRLGLEATKEQGRNERNAASNQTHLTTAQTWALGRMGAAQQAAVARLTAEGYDPDTAISIVNGNTEGAGQAPVATARINSLNNPAAQVVPVTVNGNTQVVGVNRRTMQATPVQMQGAQTVQPGNQQTVDAATQQKAMAENAQALKEYSETTAVLSPKRPDDAVALGLARRTLVATYRKNAAAAGMDPKEIDAIAAGKTQPNAPAPQQQVSIGQTATNPDGSKLQWNGQQWVPISGQ